MSAPTSSQPATAPESERSAMSPNAANEGFAGASATDPILSTDRLAPRELPTWKPKNAAEPSRRAELLKRVEQYARQRLSTLSATYSYHSLQHTEQVVNNASVIADAEGLESDLRDLLLICAWMHDVGITE